MDRAPPGKGLPAPHDNIDISRADLEAATDAAGHFGRDQARARTENRVIDQLAGSVAVDDRIASNQGARRAPCAASRAARSCSTRR